MADIDDPIVMYIVVRESLNMPTGKMCAQVGHGVQYILTRHFHSPTFTDPKYNDIVDEWLENGSRKVVLRSDEKEWIKLKTEFITGKYNDAAVVIDAGITILEPGTETCITFWPIHKSSRPKILKRLQAL